MSTEAANQWIERLTSLEPVDGVLTDETIAKSDWAAVVAVQIRPGMTPKQLLDAQFDAEVEALAYLKVVIGADLDAIGAKCWNLEKSGSDPNELKRQLARERYWKSVMRWLETRYSAL